MQREMVRNAAECLDVNQLLVLHINKETMLMEVISSNDGMTNMPGQS